MESSDSTANNMPMTPWLYLLVSVVMVSGLEAATAGRPTAVFTIDFNSGSGFGRPTSMITANEFVFEGSGVELSQDFRDDTEPGFDGMLRMNSRNLRFAHECAIPFDLLSLNLQTMAFSSSQTPITGMASFIGIRSDLSEVRETFAITQDWENFELPADFTGLVAIEVSAQVSVGGFQIDNLVLRQIPEPSVLLLCAIASAGLCLRRNRRA